MRAALLLAVVWLSTWSVANAAQPADVSRAEHPMSHGGHGMKFDATGMVMNANSDRLPEGCPKLGPDYQFTVHAGVKYRLTGDTFGLSQHEYQVEPCSRVTVTFINDDEVRHQWMIHGLPRYLYPQGMFALEAAGGSRQVGTFIVPSDDRTYLVHCDIAQHMEKGMKGELKVGRGSGDLWAVQGVTAPFYPDSYLPARSGWWVGLALITAFCLVLVTEWVLSRSKRTR